MTSGTEATESVKILIVDDKPSNLVALESFLCGDYDVVSATSGAEALARAREDEFAVVLTDVMMPVMDGFEFVKRLKQIESCAGIPIIFLTAMASDVANVFRGYELGAVDYLQKPLDPEVVKAKVAVFVQLFRQRRLIKAQADALLENERREQARRVSELERRAAIDRKRSQDYIRALAAKKRNEHLQSIQLNVTRIFADSSPITDAIPQLLETIAKGIECPWGGLWLADARQKALIPSHFWHDRSPKNIKHEESSRRLAPTLGEGALGSVWETGQASWVAGVDASPLQSGILVPISAGPEVIGIAEFLSDAILPMDDQVLTMVADIGSRIGLYIMRKRAEATLSESEERFRLLVAGVKDYAILMLDEHGKVTTWNPGAERIKGYTATEIIGQSFSCFYTPEAVAQHEPEKELEIAKTKGHYETEGPRVRKNGSIFWASALLTPLYDSAGTLKGFSKITQDITARKRAEEALVKANEDLELRIEQRTVDLKRQEAQMRAIANAMPVLVAEVDAKERLIFANDAYQQCFQTMTQDGLGLTLREFFGEHGYGDIKPKLEEVMKGQRVTFEKEVERGSTKFVFNMAYIPEFDAHQQVSGFIVVATDITPYKQIEEELKKAKALADAANAAKSTFLANMSHEIRTPLGAVLGFSELILDPSLSEYERVHYLASMKRNGDLLSNIINDILDLSKVEAGKFDVEKCEVALVDVLTDVTTLLSLQAEEKGIRLSIANEGAVPKLIWTDPMRLRQILLNIIGNAVKFTTEGSVDVKVRYRFEAGTPVLSFEVSDTGPGISVDQAPKLFEPFTQADPSTKRKYGGTGLGLVLSKRLARILGGDVALEPNEPKKGSTFVITIDPTLPRSETTSSAEGRPKVKLGLPGQRGDLRLDGAKVLLVEDAPDNRLLVGRFLSMAGAHVETAENGMEALERIHNTEYDAVLMDLQMPVMDGYEAVAALRKEGRKLPIIALTAHALKEERLRCLAAGFDDHICKPIDRGILLERITQHIGLAKDRPQPTLRLGLAADSPCQK